ncbi:CapA family protein [Desulfoluna butyratoxydans]|uniref:Capsule synthesis protein capa n=1 Tax=Desulfoluna butyratoxydans TaxID=231438 RepID=A0A4U8YRY5_9BACT|nr:CapA family protein [Desulfoluna butyratoxydans]VFQ47155.1 capsule synthesis protein capa [Desulfoluna butyratoxydans]
MTCRPPASALLFLLICILCAPAPAGAGRAGLTITAVGDIMPSSSFPDPKYLSPIPHGVFSTTLARILGDADVRFGNLEGTMAGDAPCLKACKDSTTCYAFNIPFGYADTLKRGGFNLFSLANNHISDFGEPGRRSTVARLGESGIACAGTLEKPWDILYANGLYIGFAAFAPHKGVADLLDREAAVRRVRTLSRICDVVIVSMHGGAEGNGAEHVPRASETYLGENRGDLHGFAHDMVDAGADLVIGHGPHVVRGMELYKGRLIAYSLGNFFTWARFNLEGPKGLAPVLNVTLGPDGRFEEGRIRSLRQPYKSLPVADPSHEAAREAARLSSEDFPESPLHISDQGVLSVRDKG